MEFAVPLAILKSQLGWRNASSLAEAQEIIEAAGVGIKRIGSQTEQRFRRQPRSCEAVGCDEWIPEPFDGIGIGR